MSIVRTPKRLMLFADGENLVARYQGMVTDGYLPKTIVHHHRDVYAWSSEMVFKGEYAIHRSIYYASVCGDDATLRSCADAIRQIRVLPDFVVSWVHENPWFPKVFKRSRGAARSKGVDISLTVDVLSNVYQDNCDAVMLLSGDGDYAPLLDECNRRGKHVLVGAFSSGLSDKLTERADQFVQLDGYFFDLSKSPQAHSDGESHAP